MRITPEQFLLQEVRWLAFVTLTFKSLKSSAVQRSMIAAWIRKVGGRSGVGRGAVVAMFRRELGELGGRVHWHGLVVAPVWFIQRFVCVPYGSRCEVGRWWEELGGGMMRSRRVVVHDSAVRYVTKGTGADRYEAGKFGGRSDVMLTNGLQRLLARHCGSERKLDTLDSIAGKRGQDLVEDVGLDRSQN